MVIDDLNWMMTNTSLIEHMPNPSHECLDSLATWCEFIREAPSKWKTLVRKAAKHVSSHIVAITPPLVEGPMQQAEYACDVCTSTFFSLATLRTHQSKKHQRFNPIRLRVISSICVCNSTNYHTVYGAFRHIAYMSSNRKCYYLEHMDPHPIEIVRKTTKDSEVKGDKQFTIPTVKIHLV